MASHSIIARFLKSPIQTIKEEKTLVKFMTVGASGVLINEAILYSLKSAVGLILAQAIGVELSIVNNFIWNDSFTFSQVTRDLGGKDQVKLYRLLKYNLLSLGTFSLNLLIYTLLLFELGKSLYVAASLIAILVSFVFNYLGSSRWAWKGNNIQRPMV